MGGKSNEEGMCIYVRLIHFAVDQKLTQHCKVTILWKTKKIKKDFQTKLKKKKWGGDRELKDI